MDMLECINNEFFWLKCNENINVILFTWKLPLSVFYFCHLKLFADLVLDWDSFVCSKSLLRTTAFFSVYYCQPWWNQTEELPQKSTGVPEMQYKGLVLGPFPQTGALPVTLIAHGRSPKNTCDLCCSSARCSRLHLTTNWARRENTAKHLQQHLARIILAHTNDHTSSMWRHACFRLLPCPPGHPVLWRCVHRNNLHVRCWTLSQFLVFEILL